MKLGEKMRLLNLLILIFIFSTIGCVKDEVPTPDHGPHAYEHNFSTAEFYACGKNHFGVGICDVDVGSEMSSIDFKIKGYFDGDIKITSNCGYNDLIHYTNNKMVSYKLDGKFTQSCLFGILVTPKFPNQDNVPIETSGFKGFLLVSVNKSGDLIYDFVTKIKEGMNSKIDIPIDVARSLRVKFAGCGVSFDSYVEPNDGFVTLYVNNILSVLSKQTCPLFGGINTKPTTYVNWFIQIYDGDFQNISQPEIHFNKGKVKVVAEDSVTAIFVNDNYVYSSLGEFTVDLNSNFIVRAITVGGRSQVGDYDPARKEVLWRK